LGQIPKKLVFASIRKRSVVWKAASLTVKRKVQLFIYCHQQQKH